MSGQVHPHRILTRNAAALLSFAVMIGSGNVEAGQAVHGYGWFDLGGLVAVPANRSSNESGAGFAFSSGVQFLSYVQFGGRLRYALTTQWICGAPTPGGGKCSSDWSADAASLGLELRLRLPVSPRLAVAVGSSLSVGFWSGSGTDTFGGGGKNLAADLRVAYLVGRRIGIHVAFEQQEQFGMEQYGGRLALSSFWAGINW